MLTPSERIDQSTDSGWYFQVQDTTLERRAAEYRRDPVWLASSVPWIPVQDFSYKPLCGPASDLLN